MNFENIPLVSVIIPTYKRSDYLVKAIESVLIQSYSNIEVIIVDDNDPNSEYRKQNEELLKRYEGNKKIKYIKHEKNMNGSVARNTGIRESNGEIITFLDDDDTYNFNKVQKEVEYLLKNEEYKAVYCGWDRGNKIVIPTKRGDLTYEILSGDNIVYTNTIMMWKEIAVKCGGWNETFRRHQEASFLLNYFKCGEKIGVVSENLVLYDISDRTNAPSNAKKNEEYTLHFLDTYQNEIEKCVRNGKKMRDQIYIHRYRGIFLNYIKNRDFYGAFSFYFRKCLRYNFRFLNDIFFYLIQSRIIRKK